MSKDSLLGKIVSDHNNSLPVGKDEEQMKTLVSNLSQDAEHTRNVNLADSVNEE